MLDTFLSTMASEAIVGGKAQRNCLANCMTSLFTSGTQSLLDSQGLKYLSFNTARSDSGCI